MTLALAARDFDQSALIDDRRSAQQRTRDRYLVLAREVPDQRAGRVVKNGQPLGQIGTGRNFGVRDEIDEDAIEQIDVIGSEVSGPLQEQPGDPAGHLGEAFGIALSDDLIEPGY